MGSDPMHGSSRRNDLLPEFASGSIPQHRPTTAYARHISGERVYQTTTLATKARENRRIWSESFPPLTLVHVMRGLQGETGTLRAQKQVRLGSVSHGEATLICNRGLHIFAFRR